MAVNNLQILFVILGILVAIYLFFKEKIDDMFREAMNR